MAFRKMFDGFGDDEEEGAKAPPASTIACVFNGFRPTVPQKTLPKLKADVYEIQMMPDRAFALVPHDIQTDSLIKADKGAAVDCINEIERFWTLKAEYLKYGYMHKRGFLLYGPPGTGKTSTMNQIMADTIGKDGVVVLAPLDHPRVLINMLRSLREAEPDRNVVVVMEDLDTLIRYGESELLSLLDGEHAIDNVVFIATTNYIEMLPSRIVNRPSRFDKQLEIAGPDDEMRRKYLKSRNVPDLATEMIVKVSEGLSMAHLKELIISVVILGGDLDVEVKRLKGGKKGKNKSNPPEES